jgi:8-oxo-dGTP pyrophosphatase MutT (NUDIX family)
MPLQPWTYGEREVLADLRIFRLAREGTVSPRTGVPRQCARIEAAPWVNVVAITPDRELLLVRQWRHGTREFTLEIPGGLVDPGEDPAAAAARELREETGFRGGPATTLGVVSPNPAIQDNRCHTYLIEDCVREGAPALDDGEDLEVLLRPVRDIPRLVQSGEIRHALVVCAFWWLREHAPHHFA